MLEGEAQRVNDSAPSGVTSRLDHENRATASLKASANPTAQIRSTLSKKSSASVLRTVPDKSDSVVQDLSDSPYLVRGGERIARGIDAEQQNVSFQRFDHLFEFDTHRSPCKNP